jgi:hypothetical protein
LWLISILSKLRSFVAYDRQYDQSLISVAARRAKQKSLIPTHTLVEKHSFVRY